MAIFASGRKGEDARGMLGRPKCERRCSGVVSSPSKPQKPQMTAAWTSLELGLGAIGVLVIVLGALIGRHWEDQVDQKFQEEMVLSPESRGVADWISPTVSIVTKMYFWNWTNALDIGQPGYKPAFEEVGPYTFREKHQKVNLTWNANGTVTYRQVKFWYFEPELSAGNLNDSITSVNIIAAALSGMSQNWGFFARRAVSMALVSQKQKISWTRTVAELTFEGFHNPIQSFGSYFSSKTKDRFGYFYGMNGTVSDDVYTMSTGAQDIFTIGDVRAFNYENSTPAHEGRCSEYRGSIGELWSPHQTPDSVLNMFTPDMCRTISYYYEGKSSHNGVSTLVFSSSPKSVDNGSLVEDNTCFCPKEGCEPSGVWDLRSCRDGAPVFMSLPHLYLADPVYHDAIDGMRPQADIHKFFFELEPRTGVPLKVAARLQLNVKITKNSGITLFRNVEDVLVPVWWMETVVALPHSHTSGIKLLLRIIFVGPFIAGSFIAVGVLLILFLLCRRYSYICCLREKKPPIVMVVDAEKSSMMLISRRELPSECTEVTDADAESKPLSQLAAAESTRC